MHTYHTDWRFQPIAKTQLQLKNIIFSSNFNIQVSFIKSGDFFMPHRLRLLRQVSNNIMDRILTVIISGVKSSHLGAKISVFNRSEVLGLNFLRDVSYCWKTTVETWVRGGQTILGFVVRDCPTWHYFLSHGRTLSWFQQSRCGDNCNKPHPTRFPPWETCASC